MQRKRIMIVDDDALVRGVIKRGLETSGRFEVVECPDGVAAVTAMRREPPDLVLLDLMMPGIDGGEVAYRMKLDPVLSAIPVVFLTSLVTAHEGEPGRGTHGSYRYLAKPTAPSRLINCIQQELAELWPAQRVELSRPASPPEKQAPRVLVADDDRDLRELLVSFLKLRGFDVLEANDGDSALHTLASQAGGMIDVLVADVNMPRLSGPELAKRVKLLFPRTQVMFISGYAPAATIERLVETGARFLTKPFLPNELATAIHGVLGTSGPAGPSAAQ